MKNFYKVRGKREFLFDDKDLYLLGGLIIIILGLVFALGFAVGQDLQQEGVASPFVAENMDVGEELDITDQSFDENDTPVAENQQFEETSANVPQDPKKPQRGYYKVLPDSETYVEVEATPVRNAAAPEPTPKEVAQQPAKTKKEPKQQEAKAQTPIAPAEQTPKAPAPQRTAAVVPALPNVPKNPSEDIRIGRQTQHIGVNEPIPDGMIYSVQVSSSPNREDSERLVQKYGHVGFQAFIMTADLGEKGVWYRVRVGNMPTRKDAEQLRKEILKKASGLATDPYVIKIAE